jgi:hypothetical protein
MAYRVTTEPVNRAGPAVSRRPDRTLTRNVTITSVTLGCLCLTAAGVVLLGRDRDVGSLPSYVASRKALKIAWVEPEQQAQFERNPNIAAAPKAETGTRIASRFDDTFGQLALNAPAIPPGQVPLPHARPRKLMVAKLPAARERVAEAPPVAPAPEQVAAIEAPAPETPATIEVAAEAKPEPAPSSVERAMTLMSYAPATREQLFAPEVTGSIGNPLRDLVPDPASTPKSAVPLPAKLPHDRSLKDSGAARIGPEPLVKLAKPRHKMTPQERLWGPVQVASLGPLDAIGPDGLGRDKNGIPRAPYDKQTAVYVITDKKVYMPDGSVLEAHSGLGDKKDDPRFAHVRMRGVTPPHVYDLKMREALFHGVEAIRMTPMGGEEAIFGRDGILAHSYMLGPSGQSNGCVSFKVYVEFLESFKAGKVNRLSVIAKLD